jgi:hypothetical protein
LGYVLGLVVRWGLDSAYSSGPLGVLARVDVMEVT